MSAVRESQCSVPVSFSQRREMTHELAISFLMQQAVENPGVISLAAGLVAPETLPVEEVRAAVDAITSSATRGRGALQYGTTPGYYKLRELILNHFCSLEGITREQAGIDIDNLMLTTGSQQLLSLVCEVLFDPGDICLISGPTYFVFAGNLDGVGARTVTIPVDDGGMRIDALEQALELLDQQGELSRVKLIYNVSYYDNPAGTCLATDRRRQLVELAQRYSRDHRILILEDAAYRELRYDGEAFPSIWSFDESRGWVIYTQTFSKTFSPGVRVGFGVVPRDLLAPLSERKGNEDFGSSNFAQHLVAEVLSSGAYESHLQKVRENYRAKRDAMVEAAHAHFADIDGVTWREPHGGLYVWMTLPANIPTGFSSPMFRTAVEKGVMYVPGEICYPTGMTNRPRTEMRLSYGVQSPEGIEKGMQILAEAVKARASDQE
ncbi:MAG: PLP-dependent aminotransferase family protein [Planctomycetaceae bacterium]|nr:PLP-dependent aminotransferase family protein [Planctomycetaceae bacterium]